MSKAMNDANHHLERLKHVAKNLGLPSEEALYHYNELHECYRKARPNDQAVIVYLVREAQEIWKQLQAKQAEIIKQKKDEAAGSADSAGAAET